VSKAPDHRVESIRSLARLVGRSEATVRKWIKRGDWPFGKGPFEAEPVRRWMEIHLQRDPAQRYHDAQKGIGAKPLNELEQARKANFEEAGQIRRLRRLELEGKLHDVAACEAQWRRAIVGIRNALTRSLPRALSIELVGRARGEMERIIRDRMVAVCTEFRQAGGVADGSPEVAP
jgi:hypothetical protein